MTEEEIRNFQRENTIRNLEKFTEIEREIRQKQIIQQIVEEVKRAESIHPKWPSDPVHAAAILSEEAGEVVKAVNNVATKHKGDSDYLTEAIQCAAMCVRFLKNIDKYDWGIEY